MKIIQAFFTLLVSLPFAYAADGAEKEKSVIVAEGDALLMPDNDVL